MSGWFWTQPLFPSSPCQFVLSSFMLLPLALFRLPRIPARVPASVPASTLFLVFAPACSSCFGLACFCFFVPLVWSWICILLLFALCFSFLLLLSLLSFGSFLVFVGLCLFCTLALFIKACLCFPYYLPPVCVHNITVWSQNDIICCCRRKQ